MSRQDFAWGCRLVCVLASGVLLAGCGSNPGSSDWHGPGALGVDDGASMGQKATARTTGAEDVDLTLATGASVKVRKGAVDEALTLGLTRPEDTTALALVKTLDTKHTLASAPYVVTPHGAKFKVDVEVVLPVAKGRDEEKLSVLWLEDEADTNWKVLGAPTVVDHAAKIKVDHFSVLILVEGDASMDTTPDAGDAGETGPDLEANDAAETEDAAVREDASEIEHAGADASETGEDSDASSHSPGLACGAGTWDHDHDPASACVAWTSCSAGHYVVDDGSATSDRTCSPCGARSYSTGTNALACVPHSQCPAGNASRGTPTSDIACAAAVSGLAAGDTHNCALRTDGSVACWSWAKTTPESVPGLSGVTALAAERETTCALRADGTVACWGANAYGQLGNGSTESSETPVAVYGLSDAVALAIGAFHACAVRRNGTAVCWGYNGWGQLGDGGITTQLIPVAVAGLSNVVAIAAGTEHTCALQASGTVACWGYGVPGQLGDGTATDSRTPVTVSGLANAVAIALGSSHSCALTSDGRVACWGSNGSGQLGAENVVDSPAPVFVSGLVDARALSAGNDHTCALRSNGQVVCWGLNNNGQLGDGSERFSTTASHWSATPVAVSGLADARIIIAGAVHACALRADGSVWCWGWEGASMGGATRPVDVVGLADAVSIAASLGGHTCAARANGNVACWGFSGYGQVGSLPSQTTSRATLPVSVDGLSDVVSVVTGNFHSCALRASGAVSCWGVNGQGQLGDGTGAVLSSAPVGVVGVSDAVKLAAGNDHTCALRANGGVVCWGRNGEGQLGDATMTNRSVPVAVSGLSDAIAIGAGEFHSCAVRTNGLVVCWGRNDSGQLGDGSQSYRNTPIAVDGVTDAISLAASERHTCALRANRTAVCWGSNDVGQLGDGRTGALSRPVAVHGLFDVAAIAAGRSPSGFGRSCALRTSGAVSCWGDVGYAPYGSAITSAQPAPLPIDELSGVVALSMGGGHFCALATGGSIVCWGVNQYGQLGTPLSAPFWQ